MSALLLCVVALATASCLASSTHAASALYYQTNDVANNEVVAVGIDARTGLLTKSVSYQTGGKGGAGITNVTTGATAASDPLFAQSAITAASDGTLLVVNAGSNTVTLFKINAATPTKLFMVGSPIDTMGDFPVSVTYSKKLKTACVLNGGARDGIACYRVDVHRGLVALDSAPRPVNLGQTTPPSGPVGTASQVFFNPLSTALYVTIKGVPGKAAGYLGAYPIARNGSVGRAVLKSNFPGPNILFGTAFANNSRIVIADPSIGGHVVDVGTSLVQVGVANVTGSKAVCWAQYAPATKTVFLSDGALGRITEVDPFGWTFGSTPGSIVASYTPPGNFRAFLDMAVKGSYLYALAPGNATIAVFDLSGGMGKAMYLPPTAAITPVKLSSTGLASFA